MKITTAMRAHRILKAMKNYENLEAKNDELKAIFKTVSLGESLGYYKNSDALGDAVGIFDKGLAWDDKGEFISLLFRDIVEVILPDEKKSEALILKTHDGIQFELPIKGHNERFYDSLEMLRFLRRVMKDVKSN